MSESTLTGYVDNTVHKTLAEAQASCAKKANCRGITQESSSVFRKNTGDKPSYSATRTVYFRGGPVVGEVSYDITYGSYAWTVKAPFQLTGSAAKKTYKSQAKALTVSRRQTLSFLVKLVQFMI